MDKNIICIYHSRDLDGWMSAAIVRKWFNETYPKSAAISNLDKDSHSVCRPDVISTGERLSFLGWDYGDDLPDLLEYNEVIMCDVGFPATEMNRLQTRLGDSFIWIDHHISSISNPDINENWIKGLRATTSAACELTWDYFFPNVNMPEAVRLLGRYDCFGHKGTDEEQTVMEFQYYARANAFSYDVMPEWWLGASSVPYGIEHISDYDMHMGGAISAGKTIFNYLKVQAKQIYSRAFHIEFVNSNQVSGEPDRYHFACVDHERFNPLNFDIDYHSDGYDGVACFWRKSNGTWEFSLYNGNGDVDCSMIAKSFGGGGHKGAAGFIVNVEQLVSLIDVK